MTGLHHRLDTDLRFRYQCGLSLDRKALSIATLSRVFADLTKKNLAKQLFYNLVKRCRQEGHRRQPRCDRQRCDPCYEEKKPKRKSEQTGKAN
ncbi:transposase [Paenibacillus cisolokensis]|uniref:transposase n=1 Tax=Paenibacillus cisolokensis TaxID=1658519 RepID=UPI003D2A8A27